MKIFNSSQIAQIDGYTIANEPVSEADLIRRAGRKVFEWLKENLPKGREIYIFAGEGNNGNDAITLATLLARKEYDCRLYLINGKKMRSSLRKELLGEIYIFGSVKIFDISTADDIPVIPDDVYVFDGIFGTGLNRAPQGLYCNVIDAINSSGARVISIDLPSGLFTEDNPDSHTRSIIEADYTLTFEFPKLCLFFKENYRYVGQWEILNIGLNQWIIESVETPFHMVTPQEVGEVFVKRDKFSHKGDYGHALIVGGSYGMGGAAVLAAKAAMRAGAGLVTAHIPRLLYDIMQITVPEVMCSVDKSDTVFTSVEDIKKYKAVAVGPGLGKDPRTAEALKELFIKIEVPLVVDADAINLVSGNSELLKELPANSVLTPHPGEFRRLVGESKDSYQEILKQIEFSQRHNVIVILKQAHTTISTPDGSLYLNSTGNPGMATAGSGDVLAGIIAGLLAQGYQPKTAAIIGVYLHGLAGDIAASKGSERSLIAGDITDCLGKAISLSISDFKALDNKKRR